MWATTVTKTMSEIVSANSYTVSSGNTATCYTSFSLDANVTISTSGSANCGSFWGTSPNNDWRLYQNKSGDVTVTASNGYVITSITITYSVSNTGTLKDGSTTVASNSEQSFAVNTNTTTKTYTVGNTGSATNGQVRITQFSVTYVDPSDNRAETTVTITDNETTRYMDQSATTPTATVKAGNTTVGTTVAWSSTNTNVATIVEGTGVITLVGPGTTTIKANYLGDANNYKASEASYTLNVYGVFDGISALHTAIGSAPYNTGTGSKAKITFTDAIVNYVNGNYAYIIDENGIGAAINQSSHGFTAGKIINGTVTDATLCVYSSGATIIKNVSSTTDGLTLSDGSVTTLTKAINAVTAANQSMMVKFENVTYNAASSSFTDNTNSIGYVDNFNANPTLSNGGKYDVTGLLIMDGGVLKVAPIAAEGIVSKLANPTSQWKNGEAALTSVTINKAAGNTSFTFETNSDGAVTYSSTNTAVATIAANGTITPVGYGTTTIKANTAATNEYNADEKSFTLKVGDASVDVIEIGNVTFTSGSSYQSWASVSGLTTPATYTGQSMTGQTYIQIRNQSPAGIVTTASAGRVKKISVKWAGSNTNNRYLTIYGKNTPYSSGADLYGDSKGDELGTITFTTNDTNGELTIDNEKNYGYIGILASGAMYIGVLAIEWEEDKVPVSIPASGFGTIANSNALDCANLPSGLTAYKVSDISSTAVTLADVTEAVAAGTGLILEGTASTTYSIPVAVSGTDISATNYLKAAVTAYDCAANEVYILKGGKFCLVTAASTVPAGKAYLLAEDVPAAAPELSFFFGGETTDISEKVIVKSEKFATAPVYNLNGQRVAQPSKGLYIVNGKKVIIK